MAILRVKNLRSIKSQLRKRITKALRDKKIRSGVAKIVVRNIRKETIPVKSKATIAWRKYYEKANKTHGSYNRKKINFTFTGDLLNDLISNVKAKFSKGKALFVLEQSKKKHKKYKKPDGKTSKSRALTHAEISDIIIHKLGYKYMTFSKKSENEVLAFIKKELFKRLR